MLLAEIGLEIKSRAFFCFRDAQIRREATDLFSGVRVVGGGEVAIAYLCVLYVFECLCVSLCACVLLMRLAALPKEQHSSATAPDSPCHKHKRWERCVCVSACVQGECVYIRA